MRRTRGAYDDAATAAGFGRSLIRGHIDGAKFSGGVLEHGSGWIAVWRDLSNDSTEAALAACR